MSRINYDLRKLRAVVFDVDGVLSPATTLLGSNGLPQRMVNLHDGYALSEALRCGLLLAVISGARPSGVEERFADLGLHAVVMHSRDKLADLQQWMAQNGLTPDEVAYAGDDIPDYFCMRYAGLGVCPVDAADDILAIADYISPVRGGYGVARDLLEQILKAKGLWKI